MHLNIDPAEVLPPRKPCIRDMADLVKHYLPCTVVRLVPLAELERRAAELVAEQPRFQEEAPLLVALEQRRRARHQGPQLSRRPLPRHATTLDVYLHA